MSSIDDVLLFANIFCNIFWVLFTSTGNVDSLVLLCLMFQNKKIISGNLVRSEETTWLGKIILWLLHFYQLNVVKTPVHRLVFVTTYFVFELILLFGGRLLL